jgi:hypothetical protein
MTTMYRPACGMQSGRRASLGRFFPHSHNSGLSAGRGSLIKPSLTMASHTSLLVSGIVALLFQPASCGLLAPGFNRFSRQRPEWYNRSASGLCGWLLTNLCSLHDFLCSMRDLMEQPALLGRPESTGPGKTIVAKRTVEGLRGAIAAMVYASQINADLHVRFVPHATIAYCHQLILSRVGLRTPKLNAKQTILLLNSSSNALGVFQVASIEALGEPAVDFVNAG